MKNEQDFRAKVKAKPDSWKLLFDSDEYKGRIAVLSEAGDMIRLYGFRSVAERDWFKLLQSVQGVGSKVALGILSVLDLGELASAIGTLDKAMIARAPGVGPKLAARIVSELKDKAPAFGGVDPLTSKLAGAVDSSTALPTAVSDAISALVNLGYAQAQASAAIASVIKREGEDIPAAQLIRLGLKEMAK